MKKFLLLCAITAILTTQAHAEPAKINKKLEYRFYQGCTVEQVKQAARKVFTDAPLKFRAPIATFSQQWEESAESVMSTEPKIVFTYKNKIWLGKFIQKDNGVEAYWLCGEYGTNIGNYMANAFVFGTLAANIAAASSQSQLITDGTTKRNKMYCYVLEKIEVALQLRDSVPEIKEEPPQEQTEETE